MLGFRYVGDKLIFCCGDKERETIFAPFEPIETKTETLREQYGIDDDKPYVQHYYDLKDLTKGTLALMRMLNISYDIHVLDKEGELVKDFVKYEDMPEKDQHFWYPFGYVLACLAGNAFDSLENPEYDLTKQYAAEARHIVYANNSSIKEEYRDNVNKIPYEERQNAFYHDEKAIKAKLVKMMKRSIAAFEEENNE